MKRLVNLLMIVIGLSIISCKKEDITLREGRVGGIRGYKWKTSVVVVSNPLTEFKNKTYSIKYYIRGDEREVVKRVDRVFDVLELSSVDSVCYDFSRLEGVEYIKFKGVTDGGDVFILGSKEEMVGKYPSTK